ncbi:MAG: hypothetical protein LCI00_17290 [Chloroflexi bacterium]|nr:hypothetical protein [Chloroflexota bacterium]MCC6896669.1 hypothetical protein [Anaerolineae bacterium]
MTFSERLHNRIDLTHIPFTDRGTRLMLFRRENELYIRLAERWEKIQSRTGHYRLRPPIVKEFAFLDDEGQPMPFEVESYPHITKIVTAKGSFDFVFTDTETLLMRMPAGKHQIQFTAQAERGQIGRRGGDLHGFRNIAYTTNTKLTSNEMSLMPDEWYKVKVGVEVERGNVFLMNITPRLGFNRSIPDPQHEIEAAYSRWEHWFKIAPTVLEEYLSQYDYAWWVMRAGLLSQRFYFTREALSPSKIHYVGVWQWDQFFHALAFRHVDTRLAEDQLRIVLDHQRADGMLPDAIHDEGLVTHLTLPVEADVTKPPLASWAALKVFEISQHHDFLEEVYEPLTHWHDWWITHNSDNEGLCEYHHPFSSGLDDSPLWDSGMPVTSPDLNTYMCVQQESLAQIADIIGRPEDSVRFKAMAKQTAQNMIKALWDEKRGMFMAKHNSEVIPVVSLFSLMPLWTGQLPEHIQNSLLNHLVDPALFWTQYPLATVATTDPTFDPMQMWRGPSWMNINYLFVEALKRIGKTELESKLRRDTLATIMQQRDIYEYYNPITGERPPKAAPIFGWTSAVFIDLAIQETQAATQKT